MRQDDDPVSLEFFTEDLWKVTRLGDPKQIHSFYTQMCKYPRLDVEGVLFSYRMLKAKYLRYYTIWRAKFGTRDKKYIGKKEELMSIYDFITSDAWTFAYKFDDPITAYYFGNQEINDYEHKLGEFLEQKDKQRF